MNGSALSSYAVVPFKALELLGEDHLGAHAVTKRATKHFCRRCGTPMFNLNSRYAGVCMLYLGTINGCETYSPSLNVYCESMLAWLESVTSVTGFARGVERNL